MRIEVYYKSNQIDGRSLKLKKQLKNLVSDKIKDVAIIDIYLTDFEDFKKNDVELIFSDKVAQRVAVDTPVASLNFFTDWDYAIEVTYKAGVTNPIAISAKKGLENFYGQSFEKTEVQTAVQYLIKSDELDDKTIEKLNSFLHNKLIQRSTCFKKEEWGRGNRFVSLYDNSVQKSSVNVEVIDIDLDSENLEKLSKKRLLALSLEEMTTIKNYYKREDIKKRRISLNMPAKPTDVELEMLAQTWSEHCKHKILNANITYKDGEKEEKIKSLFKEYIKQTTDDLMKSKKFLKSVFVDDSGIIEFDEDHLVCFKVETHNSPSALDPYGGAITGIVGVNRDIMGSGKSARPIFNTNVLCFGDPSIDEDEIPKSLLHPRTVLSGVHHGIIDGGNQSGIPVVAGAFVFDDSYIGKPLVFCGTGGILPSKIGGEESHIKHIDAGDLAVMIGGRIGKDGIHGATFSSLALDESSPTSAVQIGDPITQKKFNDFLSEARDKMLFKGITDNGAGGLSSSLGEMAESSGGLKVYLDLCPLKYDGLAAWEIWVSESQERMSLAIDKNRIDEFLALAKKRDVEATVVGEFTNSGFIQLYYNNKQVLDLELDFIHNGGPKMNLKAVWKKPERKSQQPDSKKSYNDDLLKILSDSTVASKEPFVRQYDHEVQAQSVLKPFVGAKSDGPSDGAVLRPVVTSKRGLTVTHGICQRYSDIDSYDMATCAVDEAFRSHIALGGNPDYVAALDNFCWPDPVQSETTPDGEYKLAQLVRCCKGLKDACLAYKIPLISGKDSMKNDANLDGKKVSIRPTLLISIMGITNDITKTLSSDFKTSDELIYIIGETKGELGGTIYEKVLHKKFSTVPKVDTKKALDSYLKLSKVIENKILTSIHDISDGGLAIAVAESAIGGRVGCLINLDNLSECIKSESARTLFCETPSRFIVTMKKEKESEFKNFMKGSYIAKIGCTQNSGKVIFQKAGNEVINLSLTELERAWKKFFNN